MPDFCAAVGCSHQRNNKTKEQGITFHRFPKDKLKKQTWTAALRRRDFVANDRSVICSCHFKPEDFDRTGQTTRLKEGVIPSIFKFPRRLCKGGVVVEIFGAQGKKPVEKWKLLGGRSAILKQVPSTPRSSRTSQQASAECQRSRSPVRGLNLSEESTSDHQYAFDPVKAKKKLFEAQEKVEELQRSIRNAKDRERRQKKAVKSLLEDLKNERMLTEELQQNLQNK